MISYKESFGVCRSSPSLLMDQLLHRFPSPASREHSDHTPSDAFLLGRISYGRKGHDPYPLWNAESLFDPLFVIPSYPARPQAQIGGGEHDVFQGDREVDQVVVHSFREMLARVSARDEDRGDLLEPWVEHPTCLANPFYRFLLLDDHEIPALRIAGRGSETTAFHNPFKLLIFNRLVLVGPDAVP